MPASIDPSPAGVLIEPDWPRHPRVRAAFTTRRGGISGGAYESFNLGTHVGDELAAVEENRRRLRAGLELPAEPGWLDQVHGTRVLPMGTAAVERCADAAWTATSRVVCAVMSADCLPVLFADDQGRCVAAAHAGWRGLAAGVLEATVAAMPVPPARLSAWLGPAIGPTAFEVGPEVYAAFVEPMPELHAAFRASAGTRHWCDLYAIARARLSRVGVTRVHGGDRCTFSEPRDFFSFRRDGVCGRMAALIWLHG